jgi:predicted phosphodiesterase
VRVENVVELHGRRLRYWVVRYLVLSDIHANIDALDAVLECANRTGYDRLVVLGDLVGYGAEPNAVVDRIRALDPVAIVRGNHDKVAAGLASADGFNPTAQRSADWTREALTAESRSYLAALPEGPEVLDDLVEICHGSPLDEDSYIFGELDAAEALNVLARPVCLFGHTHLPAAVSLDARRNMEALFHGGHNDQRVVFEAERHYLVNPGSVGQPRDGDPRASFALLEGDQKALVIRRVEYPVERARERILAAGLPKPLANRLLVGR